MQLMASIIEGSFVFEFKIYVFCITEHLKNVVIAEQRSDLFSELSNSLHVEYLY